MPRLALQLKAQLENVTSLRPADDDYMLMVKVKCTSCHEEHPKLVGIDPANESELKGSRGSAHLVMSCNFCKKECSAKFEEPTAKAPRWQPYEPDTDKGAAFQTLCILDARGCDLVGFDPQGTWKAKGTESNTVFDSIEFEDNEWTDYDEKGGVEVQIMELESQWVRA